MAVYLNGEERTRTFRSFGINLCNNGNAIFDKIKGNQTVFLSTKIDSSLTTLVGNTQDKNQSVPFEMYVKLIFVISSPIHTYFPYNLVTLLKKMIDQMKALALAL